MKYTLKRALQPLVDYRGVWDVEKVLLEDEAEYNFLYETLSCVMEGILDPDISDRCPAGYLDSLKRGKLGDFSKRYIICARDNENVIGLLLALPRRFNLLHIYTLGVIPSYRHQGVATALIAYCLKDHVNHDITDITLDVHSDNQPALNLYDKLGFTLNII